MKSSTSSSIPQAGGPPSIANSRPFSRSSEEALLHWLLYPETQRLYFVAGDDNKPTIILHPAEQLYALEAGFFGGTNDWGCERDFELQIDDEIPHYSSREVQVLEQICSGCTTTARVRVPDREEEMLCKAH